MKISVIGSGSWGSAVAALLAHNGHGVALWSYLKEESERLAADRENRDLLPGVKFADSIVCTNDISCARGADLVVCASPSPATRSVARALSPHILPGQIVVNISKGLEEGTLLRLSEVFAEEIPQARLAVMSGPSHAEEVGRLMPTTNVAASKDVTAAELVQDAFMCSVFRVYTSDDMVGVELGGALKNVIALCAGISDGLGFGDNTKAALMTRGLAEITRLGVAMGAKRETFSGLSGVGDLIVTCTSMHSRNRRAGILLGKGKSLDETLREVHMVVEGVNTATAAYKLAQKYDIRMPIVEQAYNILFCSKNPRDAVCELMTRDRKLENI